MFADHNGTENKFDKDKLIVCLLEIECMYFAIVIGIAESDKRASVCTEILLNYNNAKEGIQMLPYQIKATIGKKLCLIRVATILCLIIVALSGTFTLILTVNMCY
jgi:hypothetical protein